MFCEKCGKEIKDNVKFCPFCGNKVSEKVESRQAVQKQTSKETKKKKWLWMVGVAVILAAGGGIALGLNQNPKPQSDPQAATAKNEKAVENKDTKEEANGIQNAEEAQAWLVEQKEELGLENALSELKETSTAEVSGDHYCMAGRAERGAWIGKCTFRIERDIHCRSKRRSLLPL